jgi:hypothetical protein
MKRRKKLLGSFQHLKVGLLFMLMCVSVLTAYAQSGTVKGVVFDETGTPFMGASVSEKGTKNGTITDIDGKFTISVKNLKSSVLKFSFIGCKTVEESVNGRRSINVTLETTATTLDEVVAIGYGNRKKKRFDRLCIFSEK